MRRRVASWVPCFNTHPQTNRACQRRAGHQGAHRCAYPGGIDRWTGTGWLRGLPAPQPKQAP